MEFDLEDFNPDEFNCADLEFSFSSLPNRRLYSKRKRRDLKSLPNKSHRLGNDQVSEEGPTPLHEIDELFLPTIVKFELIKEKADYFNRRSQQLRKQLDEHKKFNRSEEMCNTEAQLKRIERSAKSLELAENWENLDDPIYDDLFFDYSINSLDFETWQRISNVYHKDSPYTASDLRYWWENKLRPDVDILKMKNWMN